MHDTILRDITDALGPELPSTRPVTLSGVQSWPSRYDVTGLATASIGAATRELACLAEAPGVQLDQRLASLWFDMIARPHGWQLPSAWDPLAGDYASADGWIRLHTNAAHHRTAALRVLGCAPERDAVAATVQGIDSDTLEQAVLGAGGCAATMRSPDDWARHPQGRAVAEEPLIAWSHRPARAAPRAIGSATRPLAGLRVLDLTRVLAGPISTRFLAAFGAEVLRIDPPHWDESALEAEVTPGKRCAGLDLRNPQDKAHFETLLRGADLLIHGYRPGALRGLGYDPEQLQTLNPDLIDISLSAYGWTGPWAGRRGFDSLVQMSCGIAAAGQIWAGADKPTPLPVQALDHATGYLMAAAALRACRLRAATGTVASARMSLARTAHLLMAHPGSPTAEPLKPASDKDLAPETETTAWGPLRRIRFPAHIEGITPGWSLPARPLRSDPPAWPNDPQPAPGA